VEYHSVNLERPLKTEELNDFGAVGWTCFSVIPPLSPGGTGWTYHFRRELPRPIRPAAPPRPSRGGLDRVGLRFEDLIGRYPDGAPIGVRGRRAVHGH
jgi:hypothetical protein